MLLQRGFVFALIIISFAGCKSEPGNNQSDLRFKLVLSSRSNIDFTNTLNYTETVNTYTFKNFYNGGGVGLGDFNNDSLVDIFFTGNMVSNKLYLNKGDFSFQDITEQAGLTTRDVWSTGVSIADIDSDGFLDIYICKSGQPGGERRHNELFINNHDLTFSEKSKEYGLDFEGLSTHASFFDFDKDGDLDCYLLNNSIRSIGAYDLRKDQRNVPDPNGGNKLLRNENGKYVDVSLQAGIYTSEIGFGLGVTIGDLNRDGWQDIYVSNDFFEKDYLYLNNKDGTFDECLEQEIREISMGSMGADMADINNDGLPEIFVTEMLPESEARLKTTSQFESWDKYSIGVSKGYYHQFGRNVLQLNNGNNSFSEISRFAGVEATDWSWGALIFDMDNDGYKDIFVANGIFKDLLDQDYVNFIANPSVVREYLRKEKTVIKRLVDSIPSNKVPNYAFHNQKDLTFKNMAMDWGLGIPTHSNGSAYGDLDNDGDLDLVINNVNTPASIYENQSSKLNPENDFISFMLKGSTKNTFALGTKITIVNGNNRLYQELSPMRGFMSSVDYKLNFGLGSRMKIDSVIVEWPDENITVLKNLRMNSVISLDEHDGMKRKMSAVEERKTTFVKTEVPQGIDFIHQENTFVDFDRDRLLFNMVSNEGPCVCVGDVNGDKLEDFYAGGARGQAGSLFIQIKSGGFKKVNEALFEMDKGSEDTDCLFFDADGNGLQDLYVTSGGYEFSPSSLALLDRLYINTGLGSFKKNDQILPVSGKFESKSTVESSDFDGDGDQDLFIGVRLIPFAYGFPGNGYILRNEGRGHFTDVTELIAPQLNSIGLIKDSEWIDVNNDGMEDLVITGEWMPIKVFINENGKFSDRTRDHGLENSNGWFNVIEKADFNGDGFMDLAAGNHGLNSRFNATENEPVEMYINDFDQNGTLEHITTRYYNGVSYPLVLKQDLVAQVPSLKKKFLHYRDYKEKNIYDIFPKEQVDKSIKLKANNFETAVYLNNGKGKFIKIKLPVQAQFAPVYSILIDDFNLDKFPDILLGGNLYRAKPETGIYDASYGLMLQGDGQGGFKALPSGESGIFVKGEIRSLKNLRYRNGKLVLVGKSNDKLQVFSYREYEKN